MSLRRLHLFWFIACLLFSQQAALLHGLAHLPDRPDAETRDELGAAGAETFCVECLALAAAGSAPLAAAAVALGPIPLVLPATDAGSSVADLTAPEPHTRGPPHAA